MDPERRKSLIDEIDVARALCQRSVELFSACYEKAEKDSAAVTPELKARVIANLKDSLEHVARLVTQHAKIEAASSLPHSWINWLALAWAKVLNNEFQRLKIPDEEAKIIIEKMREVKVPNDMRINPQVVLSLD